jgi:epoxyqueuosine reductase QueG
VERRRSEVKMFRVSSEHTGRGRAAVRKAPPPRDLWYDHAVILLETEGNVTISDVTATDETLLAQLHENAMSLGASYFGVADLAPVRPFITNQGGDFLAEYPVGVSVGVALADGVVDQLHQHLNGNVARTYRHHIYTAVAEHLDRLAAGIASAIEVSGYRAIPVPTSGHYDQTLLRGLTSHKLVAHLAGHGWIGKNCLLITKRHGPRVRWATVLTDAPLESTGGASVDVDHCKNCSLCVDLCPMQAFTGTPFDPADPVEVRFDTQKCRSYLREREETVGASACGICVYVCPHGWSMKRKKNAGRTTANFLREELSGVVGAMSNSS